MFFGCTMLMVSIALIMGVVVTNIYAKKDSYEVCPRFIVRLAQKYYPVYMKSFLKDDELQLLPMRSMKTSSHPRCNGAGLGDAEYYTDGEVESLIGSSCCRRCQRIIDRACKHSYDHQQRGLTPQAFFDRERNDAEWQMVAKFADRVLFWVYFALSIVIETMLFVQMSPTDDNFHRNNTVT